MKSQFPWYFDSEEEIDRAWKHGILTVDTNVILDIYRYNSDTRNAIFKSIKFFKNRTWLSNQAAKEFISNRKSVIADSHADFDKTKKILKEFVENSVNVGTTLNGIRRISNADINKFLEEIKRSVDIIEKKIADEAPANFNLSSNDPVLENIISAFGDRIGSAPENYDQLLLDAEQRQKKKIPPGYKDAGKDGDRRFGDFLLWSELIAFAKANQKDIIFVTSERKEDWWEEKSGKTLGPRQELLQEFYEKSGRKFFMYHTDRFVKFQQERSVVNVDSRIIEEIRFFSSRSEIEFKAVDSVEQETLFANESRNLGFISVDLVRPVKNFTCTGRLSPRLFGYPELKVYLVESPEGIPSYFLNIRSTTNSNFNIHVHSDDPKKMFLEGRYMFQYEANCDLPFEGKQ